MKRFDRNFLHHKTAKKCTLDQRKERIFAQYLFENYKSKKTRTAKVVQ